MDEVLAHYACTFENSNLHFHFQYWSPGGCTCMHAVKKERRLENEKFFELKRRGYGDGIKRKETR